MSTAETRAEVLAKIEAMAPLWEGDEREAIAYRNGFNTAKQEALRAVATLATEPPQPASAKLTISPLTMDADGEPFVVPDGTDIHLTAPGLSFLVNLENGSRLTYSLIADGQEKQHGTVQAPQPASAGTEVEALIEATTERVLRAADLGGLMAVRAIREIIAEARAVPVSAPTPCAGCAEKDAELRQIDFLMARRPALDKPTRWENIQHAINTAALADRAERLHDIAVKRAEKAEQERADLSAKLREAESRAAYERINAEMWHQNMEAADKKAEAAEARCAALEQQAQWRPIETAPKDGTRVLFYPAVWLPERVVTARYQGSLWWIESRSVNVAERAFTPPDEDATHWPFTHWQPLPAPPSRDDAERAEATETP